MSIRSTLAAFAEKAGVKQPLMKCCARISDCRRKILVRLLGKADAKYVAAHRMKIMSMEDTLEYMLKTKCSVARFGDGEFQVMCDNAVGFQPNDPALVTALRRVAKGNMTNCLVCMPGIFSMEDEYVEKKIRYWNEILVTKRKQWYSHCNFDYLYGNSDITRCYLEIKDKSRTDYIFPTLQKVWENREVVIVEGAMSRLGVGNDLFDNAATIERILCPAVGAYGSYSKIRAFILENVPKDKLILLALGPTSTVLACDLAEQGYQAVDIGNADKEYEWWKAQANTKLRNPLKYLGEIKDGTVVEDCLDSSYLSQIIARIDC
jgi:glycosyltransferase family protein